MKYYFFMLFFLFFSCSSGKESKAPLEYRDVPIKFIYLKMEDIGTFFLINHISYCYEALIETHSFPLKDLKVEVYDKEGRLLDDTILAKKLKEPESFFEHSHFFKHSRFFNLKIPYQENIKTVKVFRLDKEGNKMPERYKRSDYPERHKEELEKCEKRYENNREYCKIKNEEEREGCEKSVEEWREDCRNEEVANPPLEKSLFIDNYKTLDYHEVPKCHHQIDYLDIQPR